jgi:hypothetical protein
MRLRLDARDEEARMSNDAFVPGRECAAAGDAEFLSQPKS